MILLDDAEILMIKVANPQTHYELMCWINWAHDRPEIEATFLGMHCESFNLDNESFEVRSRNLGYDTPFGRVIAVYTWSEYGQKNHIVGFHSANMTWRMRVFQSKEERADWLAQDYPFTNHREFL